MSIYIDKVTFKKKKMLVMSDFHIHPYFEIYYLVNGSRFFTFPGGKDIKISTGDFLFVPPEVLHKTKGALISSYNIRIEKDDIPSELYDEMLLCANNYECIHTPADKRKYFENQMAEMYNEFTGREKLREMLLRNRTLVFLIDLIRFATEKIAPCENHGSDNNLEKITTFIEENYKSQLTLKTLSSVANMSESHFSHWFKKETGTTPIDYINKFRVTVAGRYILDSEMSTAEIAEKSGFKNASYFCSMFKKYTGVTANEYKALNADFSGEETKSQNDK